MKKFCTRWQKVPGSRIQAALSVCGDYVISHRTREYNVAHRPTGEHHHVGTYTTLKAAKSAAKRDSRKPRK